MKEILSKALKHNVSFWICLFIAVFLIAGGALTPPMFVIDGSIFIAVGEIWAFAALGAFIKALDEGHTASIKKGETEVTINKQEDEILHT